QGELRYLWRAVDQNGVVLDILVQSRRDGAAAKRFLKRLLKGLHYTPRVLITDKLKSYGVAKREVLPDVEHRESRYLNNRALAPADPAAIAANAAIQVDAPGPALPIRSRLLLWALPPSAPSHDCQPVSCHA
uniref:DDE-type integrase/transposase/recombinase n=1 Tax=Acidisoma sp. L85 TaxID=1641850 RepID=UPI00131D1C6E